MSDSALALVPCPPAQNSLAYVRGGLWNPVSGSLLAFVVCLGISCAGAIGGVVASVAFLTVGVTSTRLSFVRREIDRAVEATARHKREVERMRKLRPSGPSRQHQYAQLRDLVAGIERAESKHRFDLQDLLEQFIALSVLHQRFVDLLSHSTVGESVLVPEPSPRRREIMARRIRHRDQCATRITQIADDIESIDELIRLIAQRVHAPEIEVDVQREIERRLWELDEVDAAMEQLSA
jgi:hypothetical protein